MTEITAIRICPICKKYTELENIRSYQEYTLYLCTECDVMFWNPFQNPGTRWYNDGQKA
jgi:hypothetical protein